MTDISTGAASIKAHTPPPISAQLNQANGVLKPGFKIRAGTNWEAAVKHIVRARGRRGKPWVGQIKMGEVTAFAHVHARSMTEALRAIAPLSRGAVVHLRMHLIVKP